MARLPRSETMRRMRIMARGWVEMEHDSYPWSDGQPRHGPDGEALVVKAELLRSAGYKENYRNGAKGIFEDPYFLKQLELERTRYERSFLSAVYRQEMNLVNLGALMLTELWNRVVDDPGAFNSKDLATFGPQIYRLGLEIEARARSAEVAAAGEPKMKQIAQQLLVMRPEERADLEKEQEKVSSERNEELRRLISAANALDEEKVVDELESAVGTDSTEQSGVTAGSAQAS